ncbi:sugar phosphate isomerase/epimerase family protein [Paenibacillus sp.]|uniref:sugar phosphate isomerase/epimerase family protein n=1 Tax=Paenibacillus sp. TaxID=58172 RepID=UPI002D71F0D2|nr:sugar phosphate isomerase/epimerase family protein [Paenibacillus sp.]HZG88115.1 sugar phosphate isomerase/epimerase family protein [Paenibacillus sp.]
MIGLACSTVSCDGFMDNQFKATLRALPRIGYKYVEFNCWHPSDLTPSNITNLRRRCREAGVQPIALYGSSFGASHPFDISKDVSHKIRLIEAALELGCNRIVATGGRRGQSGGLDTIITVLEQVAPFAETNGVLICLENHANNNLENIEDYRKIFEAIDSPNVGLCVDTGHFDAADVDLNEVMEVFHNKINHIHVKEASKIGVEKFVRFGQGVTDNRHVIETMIDYGYSGYISVELAIEDKSNLIEDLTVPFQMFNGYATV